MSLDLLLITLQNETNQINIALNTQAINFNAEIDNIDTALGSLTKKGLNHLAKNIKLNINDTLDFWSPDGESIIYLFAPNTSFGDGNLGHLVRDIELIIWAKINLNYDVELKIVDIDLKVNKVTIMVSCTQYNLVTLDDDELYESEWKKISKKYNPKKII